MKQREVSDNQGIKQLKQIIQRNQRLGIVFAAVVVGGSYYILSSNLNVLDFFKPSGKHEPLDVRQKKQKHDIKLDNSKQKRKVIRSVALKQVRKDLFKYGYKEIGQLTILALLSTVVGNNAAKIQAELFKNIFQRDVNAFWRNFGFNLLHGVLSCILDSSKEYAVSILQIKLREQITRNVHKQYFDQLNYYYLLKVDRQITDIEQRITEDIQYISKEVGDLTNSLLGSVTDVILYARTLYYTTGTNVYGLTLLAYILGSGTLSTKLMPNFAKLFRQQEEWEGKYQNMHARLQENSESIVLYNGLEEEKSKVLKYFNKVTSTYSTLIRAQWLHSILREFFLKYAASSVAMITILRPFFGGEWSKNQSFRRDAEMAGKMRYNTNVVIQLFRGMGYIASVPTIIKKLQAHAERVQEIQHVIKHKPISQQYKLGEDSINAQDIVFDNVQIKTPLNNVLVNDLNLKVGAGSKILIIGPNGSGKSSLFRVLGDLWPLEKGKVYKPSNNSGLSHEIFYIPQRPFVTYGTLEDQILYPEQANEKNTVSDEVLHKILNEVELEYLIERKGVLDWNNVLSLGEQQRLGMARLFFHKPRFAILDECTSAVTNEMSLKFYKLLQELKCSYITISHRPTLREFHEKILALDGEGGWKLHDISDKTRKQKHSGKWTRLDQSGSLNKQSDADKVMKQASGHASDDDVIYATTVNSNDYQSSENSSNIQTDLIAQAPPPSHIPPHLYLKQQEGVNMKFFKLEGQGVERRNKKQVRFYSYFSVMYEQFRNYLRAEGSTLQKWKKIFVMLDVQKQLRSTFFPQMIVVIILRTMLSNNIAKLNGASVQHLIGQDRQSFNRIIGLSLLCCVSQAFVSPSLAYLTNRLRLEWRKKATFYLLRLYLKQYPFYAINHLFQGSQNLLKKSQEKSIYKKTDSMGVQRSNTFKKSNSEMVELAQKEQQQQTQYAPADQKMSKQVQLLCNDMANLVPNVFKPLVDLTWFTTSLAQLTGVRGLLICYSYMLFGTITLRRITPDLASLSQKQMELEGIFYQFHSRFQMQAEQIAFYGGGHKEGKTIESVFNKVIEHGRNFARVRFQYRIYDEFLTKQLPNNLTWILSQTYTAKKFDVLSEGGSKSQQGAVLHDLRYLAAVVSQCFSAFGDLLQLNGRVQEVHGYVNQIYSTSEFLEEAEGMEPHIKAQNYQEQIMGPDQKSQTGSQYQSDTKALQIYDQKYSKVSLEFQNATVCPPYQGQSILVRCLNLQILEAQNLLITGPNGSGKTALTRVLKGLWPLLDGRFKQWNTLQLDRTKYRTNIFFVPQKPYMTVGTLKQQIIYPNNIEDEINAQSGQDYKTKSEQLDEKLVELMKVVKVSYLIDRGWDEEKEWGEILSLGEQQRIGMVRAFYNQPMFAVFDECTNATSIDVEYHLYQEAINRGITIITVTQRSALMQFHDIELKLIDGQGDWQLSKILIKHSSSNSLEEISPNKQQ